ncbi:MAG TPA: DUF3471 domain-containing protein, partial [Chitinophagaceae bacterium]|nr:DUF3471 domain-containing protein [Chitinophagaceae bacterium]
LLFAITGFTVLNAQQTLSADSLQEYTGKYKFPEGSAVTEITVALENGVLYASSAQGNSELKKIEKDIFEVVAYSGKATFKRDDQAKLKGVTIEIEDLVLEGTKEESSSQLLNKFRSGK